MSYFALDSRQLLGLIVFTMGFLLLVFGAIRHRMLKSSRSKILIEVSVFVLSLAAYILEQDIFMALGVPRDNSMSSYIIDAISWLAFTYIIIRCVSIIVWQGMLTHDGELLVPKFIIHITNLIIFLIVLIFFIYFVLDKNITTLATGTAALLFGLGYLAKAPIESVFSALSFSISPMFKKGDRISFVAPHLGETIGTVKDMGWLHITVRTREGTLVYIHNLILEKGVVKNFSNPKQKACYSTEITLEYEVPIYKAYQILSSALKDMKGTIDNYTIFADKFTRFGITYVVKYWMDDKFHASEVIHALNSAVYYKIQKENKCDFGYDKFGTMNASKVSDKLFSTHEIARSASDISHEHRVALLQSIPVFESLEKSDLDNIAHASLPRTFGPPEKIIRQGESGDSMFVIHKGNVRIYLDSPTHEEIILAESGPGKYFGEMALLTGQDRAANVSAQNDVVLLEIPREALRTTLEKQPSLANTIAESVTKMKEENDALLSEANEKTRREQNAHKSNAIRKALLNFFGIDDPDKNRTS